LEIPLQAFFDAPTIAGMAALIIQYQDKKLSGKELERILIELESLSDEEAEKRLSERGSVMKKNHV
jgi:hypothetical protein